MFKFELGAKIIDKEVNDVRYIHARFLDADSDNLPIYALRRKDHGTTATEFMSAKTVEKYYKTAE